MKNPSSRVVRLLGLLAALGLLLAACGDDGSSDDGGAYGGDGAASEERDCTSSVCMEGIEFVDGDITVAANETVDWTNLDTVEHTVTEGSSGAPVDGGFDSGNIGEGESFEITADEAGEISYHCTIHPQMEGTITVE